MADSDVHTDSHWQMLRALFSEALEVDSRERGAWLDRHCEDNAALRADLERLLAAHEAPDNLLDGGSGFVEGFVATLREESQTDPRVGARIGAYRLLELLGRGGMGTVYLAERADGHFRQQVALKLICDEAPTPALRERFLRERDILARLSHQNIAQLHEGGVTADGLPYFTLERVEGEPITRWCDAHRIGIRERLQILVKVCDAVQYAHRNLVVHRDIKPSNILVTASGEPKLLDFGIAKFLDGESTGMDMTDVHARPMTREYAAPEQVLAQPITTVTDVYALGILFYELLSGRLPYPQAESGTISWAKAIVEEAPEPLSRAVTRVVDGVAPDSEATPENARAVDNESIAMQRGLSVTALKRILRGDLETIARRALEKAPEARYPSAASLGAALDAYLHGRAQPDSDLPLRIRKFLRRHALPVAVASVLLVVAAAGLAGMVWEARQTALAGRRAQTIQQFLTSVFDVSDPDRSQGQTVTARELLDEGARRAESELVDQPELQSDLLRLIGTLYFRLGLYSRAETLQEQALALLRRTESSSGSIAAGLTEIAETERSQQHYAEAEAHLTEALSLEVPGRGDQMRAQTLGSLGMVLGETARNAEAERTLREALALDRRLHKSPDERTAADQERLAQVLAAGSGYEEANALLSDSLRQQRELHGERHSTLAKTLEERAKLAWTRGDLDSAERDFEAVLDMRRALFGPRHPSIAETLYWVAGLRSYQGRYAEAEALSNEALAINAEAYGTATAHDAPFHDLLAEVAQANNDLDRAEREARSALAIWQAVLGESHSETANGLQRLALIERDRGNTNDAIALLRKAVDIRRTTLGPNTERVGFTLANLAETLRIAGDPATAAGTFRQALAVYRASLPAIHPRVVEALSGIGRSELDGGDAAAAIATLEPALAMARTAYPKGHPDRMRVLLPLGLAYLANGDVQRAAETLGEAKALIQPAGPTHVRNAVQTLIALARACTALRRYDDATSNLAAAHALLLAHPQDMHALSTSFEQAQRELDAAHPHVQHASRAHAQSAKARDKV
jgi:eukaryotic-like serine/threonine-protein kinase